MHLPQSYATVVDSFYTAPENVKKKKNTKNREEETNEKTSLKE